MKNLLSLILCASACVFGSVPAVADDGFTGAYQPAQPQQFQPIAPGQGYGQISQLGAYQPSPTPPGQYQAPQYQQQQQQPYQQAPYQQQPPYPQQGAQGGGQDPTFYGYTNTSQPYPPQQYGGQQPQYQQQPNGQQQQAQYAPQQQQPTPGLVPAQGNLEQQAQSYFQQVDQNKVNTQQADNTAQDAGTVQAQDGESMAGLKRAGKMLVGVGSAVAGAYVMNKMMNRTPQQRMQNQMARMQSGGMGGMGMGGMGMGGMGMGGMGMGGMGMGGMPYGYGMPYGMGGGYPSMPMGMPMTGGSNPFGFGM